MGMAHDARMRTQNVIQVGPHAGKGHICVSRLVSTRPWHKRNPYDVPCRRPPTRGVTVVPTERGGGPKCMTPALAAVGPQEEAFANLSPGRRGSIPTQPHELKPT